MRRRFAQVVLGEDGMFLASSALVLRASPWSYWAQQKVRSLALQTPDLAAHPCAAGRGAREAGATQQRWPTRAHQLCRVVCLRTVGNMRGTCFAGEAMQ